MLLQTGWILFLLCLVNRFAGKQPLLTSLMHSELFLANITNIFFLLMLFVSRQKMNKIWEYYRQTFLRANIFTADTSHLSLITIIIFQNKILEWFVKQLRINTWNLSFSDLSISNLKLNFVSQSNITLVFNFIHQSYF